MSLVLANSFNRNFCTFFGSMRRSAAKTMIDGAPFGVALEVVAEYEQPRAGLARDLDKIEMDLRSSMRTGGPPSSAGAPAAAIFRSAHRAPAPSRRSRRPRGPVMTIQTARRRASLRASGGEWGDPEVIRNSKSPSKPTSLAVCRGRS